MTARVVVLGTGFAGCGVMRALAGRGDLHVTGINRENYQLFTPMLPEVASGAIEPRHIAEPVRAAVPRATFVLGDVRQVDFDARTVTTAHPVTGEVTHVPYDHLVVALGAASSTGGVPGAGSHAIELKTLDDAVRLRAAVTRALEGAAAAHDQAERRRLLTFVVVGGGFTGVEAAGELQAFLGGVRRRYRELAATPPRVVLVAGGARLLEQLPGRFGERASAMLRARGVEIVRDDRVASVDAGGLTLASGERFEARTVIWSAGVRVPDVVRDLPVPHSEHGAVVVNADLSVPGHPNVWALGDCAQIPRPGGGHYPQTAQHAVREAKLLARNLRAALRGKRTRPFGYRSPGMMASLGGREGLADIAGRLIAGTPAWLLWRAYYLARLPGASRKARVAADWIVSLPFPIDIASVPSST